MEGQITLSMPADKQHEASHHYLHALGVSTLNLFINGSLLSSSQNRNADFEVLTRKNSRIVATLSIQRLALIFMQFKQVVPVLLNSLSPQP